jgi:hypothetical protein
MFDLQGFRTVKGQAVFPTTGLSSGFIVVTNEYDNSPVDFNPGDIIIALTLANGSTSYPGTSYTNPFSGGSIQFYTHDGKTLPLQQQTNGTWTVNPSFTTGLANQLTSSINLSSFGTGIPSASNPPVSLNATNTLSPLNCGFGLGTLGNGATQNFVNLVCSCTSIPASTVGYSAVNVTMLVMNSSLAQ